MFQTFSYISVSESPKKKSEAVRLILQFVLLATISFCIFWSAKTAKTLEKKQEEVKEGVNREQQLMDARLTAVERKLELVENKMSDVVLSLMTLTTNLPALIDGTLDFSTQGRTTSL